MYKATVSIPDSKHIQDRTILFAKHEFNLIVKAELWAKEKQCFDPIIKIEKVERDEK